MTATKNVKRLTLIAVTSGLMMFAACSQNNSPTGELGSSGQQQQANPLPMQNGQNLAVAPSTGSKAELSAHSAATPSAPARTDRLAQPSERNSQPVRH